MSGEVGEKQRGMAHFFRHADWRERFPLPVEMVR